VARVDAAAAQQMAPRRDDALLLGYFVGNEPPWPGREDYNIGFVDVTDRPYPELVDAARKTHRRLPELHAGGAAPFDRMPRASEAGTPSYRLSDSF
jgi:hypothetical protein